MSWLDEIEIARKNTPPQKRQEFLIFFKSGLTLGESAEKAGISFEAANGICRKAIKTTSYFDFSDEEQ